MEFTVCLLDEDLLTPVFCDITEQKQESEITNE